MASSSFPTWLALSDGGPVADLASIVGARTIQMTTDPLLFRRPAPVRAATGRDHLDATCRSCGYRGRAR
jgi:hypothetical protein